MDVLSRSEMLNFTYADGMGGYAAKELPKNLDVSPGVQD